MIKVEDLLYDIDLKLNKQATSQHQFIPDENKIVSINSNQIKLVLSKLNPNNILQLGFEGNIKRYQDIENLIEPYDNHSLEPKLADKYLNKWEASLLDLVPIYMFYIDAYLIAKKGDCRARLSVNNSLAKHKDVQLILNNSNERPDFDWRETFSTLTSNKIEVYTDGTFTPEELYVSYIRYPQMVDIEGYTHLDGTISVTQDCELEYYLKEALVNLVVEDLAMSTDNIPAAQSSQSRKQNDE